jgi:hypothetical protein
MLFIQINDLHGLPPIQLENRVMSMPGFGFSLPAQGGRLASGYRFDELSPPEMQR